MTVIGINYDQDDNSVTYKSVELYLGSESNNHDYATFNSGYLPQDWFYAMCAVTELGGYVTESSDVHHFISDGGNKLFEEVHLRVHDDDSTQLLSNSEYMAQWETLYTTGQHTEFCSFFVEKGKTFADWPTCKAYLTSFNPDWSGPVEETRSL